MELIKNHTQHQKLVTVTTVQPNGRYGAISCNNDQVIHFEEKPKGDGAWINGGFFVINPAAFDYIENELTTWEQAPLCHLAKDGQLMSYQHAGFWQAMDTLRDKNELETLWASGRAPWKTWA